nr:M56 family metallopeptidase [uncultured Clostridium sp.]
MLERVFLQILNMSFTASIVIAFVLAVRMLLQKALKVFSYALWSVVLFRLICPFSLESVFSLLPTKANPISQEIIYMQVPKIDTGIESINNSVNMILPAASPQASVNPLQTLIFIGSQLWLLGTAALLVYSLVMLFRLKKHLQDATLCQDNIFISSKIVTAFVMGIFCPKIYLPSNLNKTERNYILLHEQTHIKRNDHIIKLLSFLILCIHWFNPFVWIAFYLSGKDIEMCCDEAVIKRLGNDVKKDYSASLLTLTTGRRIVGGIPLAFGEGDTKGRVKNVLNYKKPTFWVVLAAIITVVFVVIGLTTSPKKVPNGFAGVNATILEIDKDNKTMTVKGIDTNSPIGDNCIVSWENANLQTVTPKRKPMKLSIDDFAEGDYVVLFLGEIQESYPTRAKASTILLQTKGMPDTAYPVEDLWNARTKYVGDNSAVGKLTGLLPVPIGLQYDHFELQTSSQPYKVVIVYSVPTELLAEYDRENSSAANSFRANALFLLALIENADEVQATLTDGSRKVDFTNRREWADQTVDGNVSDYARSPEKLQELIDFIGSGTTKETVEEEYSIMKLGKNGEVLFKYSSETQSLARAIIMNAAVKSAAWEGVDITTLEECYRIRQTFPQTQEVHDYYAYRLKDGTAVLQSGAVGQYSILSDDLYETLTKYVISPDIDGDALSIKNTNYSLSLTAGELRHTEEVVRNYFTTEAPYYEGIVSIELMPDDDDQYKNPGIEENYAAGNIIIYKVLTLRDEKGHNPQRAVSVARDSKETDWKVINQGY